MSTFLKLIGGIVVSVASYIWSGFVAFLTYHRVAMNDEDVNYTETSASTIVVPAVALLVGLIAQFWI